MKTRRIVIKSCKNTGSLDENYAKQAGVFTKLVKILELNSKTCERLGFSKDPVITLGFL